MLMFIKHCTGNLLHPLDMCDEVLPMCFMKGLSSMFHVMFQIVNSENIEYNKILVSPALLER